MEFVSLKSEFPFCNNFINLNNAGICPPPMRSVRAVQQYHQALAQNGVRALMGELVGYGEQVRASLSRILGCGANEIAITHNTAEGLNFIAQGYPFQPGDLVLTSNREYSCNVLVWKNLASRGVEVIMVPEIDGEVRLADIQANWSSRIKLVSLSAIQWCSGCRLDIESIGLWCESQRVPLVIDAAQAVGAIKLDVKKMRIAALSCPAWKWLWGPLGVGFLYIDSDWVDKIKPVFVGAENVASWNDPLCYDLIFRQGMAKFQYSTLNYADIVQWSSGLKLIELLGIERIEKRLLGIVEKFQNVVQDCGGKIYGNFNCQGRSGIFSFTHPKLLSKEILQQLSARDVVAQVRDGRVRVAPHVYLDSEDVARFGAVLAQIVG